MPPLRSIQPRLLAGMVIALVVVALIPFAAARLPHTPTAPPPLQPAASPLAPVLPPQYSVSAGLDGEIFPAFANYASLQKPGERKLATVAVTVHNSTPWPLRNRVAVHIPGWSDPEIQYVEVPAGQSRVLAFAPSFLARFYRNHEIVAATAVVNVTDSSGHALYSTTVPVRLRAADDIYWGASFQYARFIASWVTPHDPQVEEVLRAAKESVPARRLPGYESWKSSAEQVHETYLEAQAIYRALQAKGVSYVKSSVTLGDHQGVSERVRMPRESLRHVSANCIDGVVMFASMFENLGMDAEVVLVPGHAYVAVREAQNSDSFLYIETTMTGRASFEDAVLSANRGMKQWLPNQVIRIAINQSRAQGIYPLPVPLARSAAASD